MALSSRISALLVAIMVPACGGSNATHSSGGSGGGASADGGGAGAGAAAGAAAAGASACPLPSSFAWKDFGGPLAQPKAGWVSLKDFTSVVYNGQHIVYSSMHDQSSYGSQMMMFSDWPDAASAAQVQLPTATVAPTLFYFTPKQQWILAYQWCSAKFCYATSTDPTNAASWSFGHPLLAEDITSAQYGPIDQTVICDSARCYLFYGADNGHVYRASMPIDEFPGTFSGSESIISEAAQLVFEAVQVYSLKGIGKYLMLVETSSTPRYFRAYVADRLDGEFTAISGTSSQMNPFASRANVTFEGSPWTADISHGDLVRENPDETMTVDPCNLQLLYQGRDASSTASYDLLPYRPGLLTLIR
jgi:hypothetical protein